MRVDFYGSGVWLVGGNDFVICNDFLVFDRLKVSFFQCDSEESIQGVCEKAENEYLISICNSSSRLSGGVFAFPSVDFLGHPLLLSGCKKYNEIIYGNGEITDEKTKNTAWNFYTYNLYTNDFNLYPGFYPSVIKDENGFFVHEDTHVEMYSNVLERQWVYQTEEKSTVVRGDHGLAFDDCNLYASLGAAFDDDFSEIVCLSKGNGAELWKKSHPGQSHNLIVIKNHLYCLINKSIFILDPILGDTIKKITSKIDFKFGNIAHVNDVLFVFGKDCSQFEIYSPETLELINTIDFPHGLTASWKTDPVFYGCDFYIPLVFSEQKYAGSRYGLLKLSESEILADKKITQEPDDGAEVNIAESPKGDGLYSLNITLNNSKSMADLVRLADYHARCSSVEHGFTIWHEAEDRKQGFNGEVLIKVGNNSLDTDQVSENLDKVVGRVEDNARVMTVYAADKKTPIQCSWEFLSS